MPVRFFIAISILLFAFDQPKLVKTKVTDDITVSIPKDWIPMQEMDFVERYPSVRAPLAAFTNHERTTDFSVNISATRWPDANAEIAQPFFKSSVMNMFDRVEMISEGVQEVHGKKFVYFEFESRINGNKTNDVLAAPVVRYTYQQYLIEPDRTLVFSFTCPARLKETWQETARAMMKTIKVSR